jgi:hypothetical protein
MQFAKGRRAFKACRQNPDDARAPEIKLLTGSVSCHARRRGILLVKEFFHRFKNRISTSQGTEIAQYVDFLLVRE